MDNQSRLRAARRARKVTQDQLAALSGVSQAWISKIELGARPREKQLTKLASALGIAVSDLSEPAEVAA